MNLLYRILSRLSILFTLVLGVWAVLFYFMIIKEINDEVDDLLEDYAEQLIIKSLAGEDLPENNSASNNQYFLTQVTEEYANKIPHIRYEDEEIYIDQERDSEPARVLYTIFRDNDGKYHQLTVSSLSIEKDDLRESILYWMIFLYITLLLLVMVINIVVYKRSIKPLHKALQWLDSYKVGTNNQLLNNDTNVREFQKLNHAITESMRRTEDAFEHQKQFIGNASHEMQTPIAVSMNRIEMLMDDDSLSEDQLNELAKVYDTLLYMSKLNKSLLLLSKIDNKQFVDRKPTNCNPIIKKISDDYTEIYEYLNIHTKIIEQGNFVIDINETLATMLFTNLIKNAFLHNIENGFITIVIGTDSIIFKNTGENNLEFNNETIFNRFVQGNKKRESTGLGLAIVKSICNIEQLDVKYFHEKDEHCFQLSRKKT